MRPVLANAAAVANAGTEQAFGVSTTAVRSTAGVMQKARGLWPRKTAAEVAARAHVSPRAAEHWLSGKRTLSAEAIVHLLRSEEGLHFLSVLMERARPAWWSALLRLGVFGSIERRRAADLRLLKRIVDADASVPAGPAAALSVQDPEFFEPFAAALEAARGAPHRAVDQTTKRRT